MLLVTPPICCKSALEMTNAWRVCFAKHLFFLKCYQIDQFGLFFPLKIDTSKHLMHLNFYKQLMEEKYH